MASELSAQLASARERDRKLFGSIQFMPSRQRSLYSTPLSPINSSGHSRVLSEHFTPGSIAGGSIKRIHLSEKRASSALGPLPTSWSPVEQLHYTRTLSLSRGIRGSRSQEQMRNDRIASWQASTIDEHPLRRVSPASNSNSSGSSLEPLPENETSPNPHTLQRPGSTTTDLRAQMNELKGRISSLQNRAREDSMRRRSLQSLRTPSPFAQAEAWYTGVDDYNGDAATNNSGIGGAPDSPEAAETGHEIANLPQSSSPDHAHFNSSTPPTNLDHEVEAEKPPAQTDYAESTYEDAQDATDDFDEEAYNQTLPNSTRHLTEAYEHLMPGELDEHDEIDMAHEDDFAADDASLSGRESIYGEPEYIPMAERHEDRADAFDYEHFFLHSAMGTYSAANRRGSISSEDSVETTRPLSPIRQEPEVGSPSRPFHHRNQSASSISSIDTFQTATEGQGSDESDNESTEDLDEITQQIIDHNLQAVQHHQRALNVQALNGARADSAVVMPERYRAPEKDIKYSASQRIVQALMESASASTHDSPMAQEDRDLIYALALGMEKACNKLYSLPGNDYEKRVWRRRLDDARRILDGEGEGEAF